MARDPMSIRGDGGELAGMTDPPPAIFVQNPDDVVEDRLAWEPFLQPIDDPLQRLRSAAALLGADTEAVVIAGC